MQTPSTLVTKATDAEKNSNNIKNDPPESTDKKIVVDAGMKRKNSEVDSGITNKKHNPGEKVTKKVTNIEDSTDKATSMSSPNVPFTIASRNLRYSGPLSHAHSHGGGHAHGHDHDILDNPGKWTERDPILSRDFSTRAFTIGIGGPVGSGKTALVLALCQHLRDLYNIVVVTNDIFTKEDCEFLTKHNALPSDRIRAVETGGCPHAAVREDCSANLTALEELTYTFRPHFAFVEAGGDNLAANFSRELADFIIYVIDVAGGDKVPRKGGPGITQSDLLVINKTDLADAVGADLILMEEQALVMREGGPVVMAQVKHNKNVDVIASKILEAYKQHMPNK